MGITNIIVNIAFMILPWFIMSFLDMDGLSGWLLVLCAADIGMAAGAHTHNKVNNNQCLTDIAADRSNYFNTL